MWVGVDAFEVSSAEKKGVDSPLSAVRGAAAGHDVLSGVGE